MDTNEARIDRFYADMTDAAMLDTLDHIHAVETSIPDPRTAPEAGFEGMAWVEIVAVCDEYDAEAHAEAIARYWNSRL